MKLLVKFAAVALIAATSSAFAYVDIAYSESTSRWGVGVGATDQDAAKASLEACGQRSGAQDCIVARRYHRPGYGIIVKTCDGHPCIHFIEADFSSLTDARNYTLSLCRKKYPSASCAIAEEWTDGLGKNAYEQNSQQRLLAVQPKPPAARANARSETDITNAVNRDDPVALHTAVEDLVAQNDRSGYYWRAMLVAGELKSSAGADSNIYKAYPKNPTDAEKDFLKAAEMGDSRAFRWLAIGYKHALFGLEKDQKRADYWGLKKDQAEEATTTVQANTSEQHIAPTLTNSTHDSYNCSGLESKLESISVDQLRNNIKTYSDFDLICAHSFAKSKNKYTLSKVIMDEIMLPERRQASIAAGKNECQCTWRAVQPEADTKDSDLVKKLTKLAEQGDARAQFYLAQQYAKGDGVAQDEMLAISWYKKSAENGNELAQLMMAALCRDGLGGEPKDIAKSIYWYKKAATQGNVKGQVALGDIYGLGLGGIPKDYSTALNWYRQAADKSDVSAQFNLGLYYDLGRGIARNDQKSIYWYLKAAKQEHSDAQFNLALKYTKLGDDKSAAYWISRAASNGNKEAIDVLKNAGIR